MPVHRLNGCQHRRLSWQKRGWLRKNYLKMYCLSEPETKKKKVAFRDATYIVTQPGWALERTLILVTLLLICG